MNGEILAGETHHFSLAPKKDKPGKNKGDYAEFYAFLKLLFEGVLQNRVIEFIKRLNAQGEKIYTIDRGGMVCIDGKQTALSRVDLGLKLVKFFGEILEGNGWSFQSETAMELAGLLGIMNIKSSPCYKDDFIVKYVDDETLYGYDVKANFAAPPCIINADKWTTGFIYEVCVPLGGNPLDCAAYKRTYEGEVKLLASALSQSGCAFLFSPDNPTDPALPIRKCHRTERIFDRFSTDENDIMPKLLLQYYSKLGKRKVNDVLESFLHEKEEYGKRRIFWRNQVKEVLWKGYSGYYNLKREGVHFDGSIHVRGDGSIDYERLNVRSVLEAKLYERCCFDTGATKRHEHGYLYEVEGKTYIKLNFSVKLDKAKEKKT